MSIELKQAAEKALVVLGSATSFMSRKARDQHESVVAELHTAIQQAESEPVAWPLRAQVWKRESTQEWVLEIAGTLGDTDMNIRHTQPLSVAYENVPGLPTFYTHPAPGVPDGHVLVPIKPTAEMMRAWNAATSEAAYLTFTERGYDAMLTAAQAQKGGECLPIRGNQVTCSRGTGGCGIQHKGGD